MTLRQLAAGRVTPRQWAKYHWYNRAGVFPYFGYRVYFPKGCSAFQVVCAQGIFEAPNVRILQRLCRPGSYMFDVGANLGLMALPVLRSVSESRVVSFEPSPNTVQFLRRTVKDSGLGDRWRLVEKAVAYASGTANFSLSARTEGLYDGLRHTHRTAEARQVQVEVTSLDEEWMSMGCPPVSMIKIDVEGGELDVLRGARECLSRERPLILLEWSDLNLPAYDIPRDALFPFSRECFYMLYALPEMIPIATPRDLSLQVIRTESFLMVPVVDDASDHLRASSFMTTRHSAAELEVK
ncbi:MAG: FkbM family methyltransferase [Bryobacteraceae bacterium]|jgi:FkbM family methyltransferase